MHVVMLRDIVAESAARDANKVALIFREQSITYGELQTAVHQLAAGFHALGIRVGDRIGLLLPNCPQFVISYYAAAQIGAVVVPSNPLLKPGELEYIWRDASLNLVVTAPPLLGGVVTAAQGLSEMRHILSIGPVEPATAPSEGGCAPSISTFASVLEAGAVAFAQNGVPNPVLEADSCAVIIYTSGTTGHPKGAMLSHRNLTRNVEQIQAVLKFESTDSFVTVLPLFHSFAGTVCLNTSLTKGCTTILLDSFVPGRILEMIERYRATVFPAVPAMFQAMLQFAPDRTYDLSSLRFFVSGGAPLHAQTLQALEDRFGVPVLEGDGPTECSPVTSANPMDGLRKPFSVGPALPGVEIAIFDDTDRPLPTDEIGEIVVRGDNVMLGYLNQPEATAEAMRNGWYHTGDLGKIDADGYVFIVDRKKDMLLVAGMNVYPREVEEVIQTHPGVADVAVIGLPDARRGEEVVAVVVRHSNVELNERDLVVFCRERMANFKVPRRVLFRDVLPRGGTGKVVKRLLKKELELEIASE